MSVDRQFPYEKANRRRDLGCTPFWAPCMEYDFQLRREAMALCREQGCSTQAALWAAYRNRVKHWVTLLSIANNRCDTTSDKAPREAEQLKKQVAQLQKARFRSPRGGGKGSRKRSRGHLALQDSTVQASNKGKGGRAKGEKGNKSGSGTGKDPTHWSLCGSPQQCWVQGSPQAQQDESWFLLPFPKRILLETELQAAPQLCRLRKSGSTVQKLPMPGSPLDRDLIGRSIGLAAFQHGDAS